MFVILQDDALMVYITMTKRESTVGVAANRAVSIITTNVSQLYYLGYKLIYISFLFTVCSVDGSIGNGTLQGNCLANEVCLESGQCKGN